MIIRGLELKLKTEKMINLGDFFREALLENFDIKYKGEKVEPENIKINNLSMFNYATAELNDYKPGDSKYTFVIGYKGDLYFYNQELNKRGVIGNFDFESEEMFGEKDFQFKEFSIKKIFNQYYKINFVDSEAEHGWVWSNEGVEKISHYFSGNKPKEGINTLAYIQTEKDLFISNDDFNTPSKTKRVNPVKSSLSKIIKVKRTTYFIREYNKQIYVYKNNPKHLIATTPYTLAKTNSVYANIIGSLVIFPDKVIEVKRNVKEFLEKLENFNIQGCSYHEGKYLRAIIQKKSWPGGNEKNILVFIKGKGVKIKLQAGINTGTFLTIITENELNVIYRSKKQNKKIIDIVPGNKTIKNADSKFNKIIDSCFKIGISKDRIGEVSVYEKEHGKWIIEVEDAQKKDRVHMFLVDLIKQKLLKKTDDNTPILKDTKEAFEDEKMSINAVYKKDIMNKIKKRGDKN